MIKTIADLEQHIAQEDAVLVYFSHEACNVCKVLKPKVSSLLETTFPKFTMSYVDTVLYPDIPAQKSIFTVPTIVVYFMGKEYFRWSRNISIEKMEREINRPYEMLFQ